MLIDKSVTISSSPTTYTITRDDPRNVRLNLAILNTGVTALTGIKFEVSHNGVDYVEDTAVTALLGTPAAGSTTSIWSDINALFDSIRLTFTTGGGATTVKVVGAWVQ